jgi:dipeptidase
MLARVCDTTVRVLEGRVLFAKNSDRDPDEAQRLDWQPARDHAPGSRVRCTWVEIPQARRTLAVLLSRPFWMWGAEIGANERGVVIGNEAVFTREPYAPTGLTGMDLVRLALERSESAQVAVDTLCGLLDAHGQGGGCGYEDRGFTYHNSFLVADAGGAFVVETAGRRWAVERVSEGARSISNGLTIPAFARQYADPVRTRVACAAARGPRTASLAAAAEGPGDMMRLLRDHGAGRRWPRYSIVNGCMDCPCMHAGGLVAASQTTASWVAELRPDGASHWVTGTSAPCLGLFKPVRVDAPLDLGRAPTGRPDRESLFWRAERLHRRVMRDPARLAPCFLGERDAIEAAWLRSPPPPGEAFREGSARLDAWAARVEAEGGVRDLRPRWVQGYWRRRGARRAS